MLATSNGCLVAIYLAWLSERVLFNTLHCWWFCVVSCNNCNVVNSTGHKFLFAYSLSFIEQEHINTHTLDPHSQPINPLSTTQTHRVLTIYMQKESPIHSSQLSPSPSTIVCASQCYPITVPHQETSNQKTWSISHQKLLEQQLYLLQELRTEKELPVQCLLKLIPRHCRLLRPMCSLLGKYKITCTLFVVLYTSLI